MPTLFPENQTDSLLITKFVITTASSETNQSETISDNEQHSDNWWALLTLILVVATAAGNILVCLAISWEKRLQNVTNYFLMSLAVTDLMVAILVMPLGILTLFKGYFPLESIYCLLWICLDVLFCTASIMHLCTISVDRYLSLRYPMKFGRNKTRRRVILKIIFVWLLSIAMSLPLCLMYSQNRESVLINGSCQIPDPLYKLIGSIICFYIPLLVMLGTYMLTVQLLAQQQKNLGGRFERQPNHWFVNTSNWFPSIVRSSFERHKQAQQESPSTISSTAITPRKTAGTIKSVSEVSTTSSTDNQRPESDEIDVLYEAGDLWLDDFKEENSTVMMSALQQFGAQMLQLSRGLQDVDNAESISQKDIPIPVANTERFPSRRTFSVYENKTSSEINRKKLQVSKSETSNEEIELKPIQMIVKANEKSLSLKRHKNPKITTSLLNKNSSRHGRILLLEQKATKVLGIVFFTFVILWAPFFVLNLLPVLCEHCEQKLSRIVFDFVTWLGYASSMINPIFYTIFNKIFRQTFVKVLRCHYCRRSKHSRMPNSFKIV